MARRSYGQYCTLAQALDIIGERWTLLIVRELMLGPRRFKDLLHGLPGIGRNLLTERLRRLEAEGLVGRGELPAPAGSRVYELTAEGRELGPSMVAISRWGIKRLAREPGQVFRPAWGMFPLSYGADPEAARRVRETYEFRVGSETFHLKVRDGEVKPFAGAVEDPDVVATMDDETLLDLLSNVLAPVDAVTSGRVHLEGDPDAVGRLLSLYGGNLSPA